MWIKGIDLQSIVDAVITHCRDSNGHRGVLTHTSLILLS